MVGSLDSSVRDRIVGRGRRDRDGVGADVRGALMTSAKGFDDELKLALSSSRGVELSPVRGAEEIWRWVLCFFLFVLCLSARRIFPVRGLERNSLLSFWGEERFIAD